MGIPQNSGTSVSHPLRKGCASDSLYRQPTIILAESRKLILDHTTGMQYLLGFIVSTKKSVLNPAQVIEFLGLTVDSITMEIRLFPTKIKQIQAEAHKLVWQKSVSACMLAQLL